MPKVFIPPPRCYHHFFVHTQTNTKCLSETVHTIQSVRWAGGFVCFEFSAQITNDKRILSSVSSWMHSQEKCKWIFELSFLTLVTYVDSNLHTQQANKPFWSIKSFSCGAFLFLKMCVRIRILWIAAANKLNAYSNLCMQITKKGVLEFRFLFWKRQRVMGEFSSV